MKGLGYVTSVMRLRWRRMAADLRRGGMDVDEVLAFRVDADGWTVDYVDRQGARQTIAVPFEEER